MSKSKDHSLKNRDTIICDIPATKRLLFLHPEQIMLRMEGIGGVLDLGSLCYLRRSYSGRQYGKGRCVDPASLSSGRQKHVQRVLESLVREVGTGSLRSTTAHTYGGIYLRFMDWCDQTGRHNAVLNEAELRQALKSYVAALRERVQTHTINQNTAAQCLSTLIPFLERVTGWEYLGFGINLIRGDRRLTDSTEAPDERAVGKVLAWSECLLKGFGDLLLNGKPYPFALTVPSYLGMSENRTWVFPTRTWAVTHPDSEPKSSVHVDYSNGRIRTLEEYDVVNRIIRKKNNRTLQLVSEANEDLYHSSRIERGMLAMKGYYFLMLASSGQNSSSIASLPWSPELEEQVREKRTTRQQFRAIKYRARHATINFEIGVRHTPLLLEYLRLREYLLQGRPCDYLFFSMGSNNQGDPQAITGVDMVNSFYTTIRNLDPSIPKVTPRQFRSSKQDFLILTTDPATAAIAMQHSVETADRNYTNGSPTRTKTEWSAFWAELERKSNILSPGENPPTSQERGGGRCKAPNQPKPIIEKPPVKVDCKTPEGCFFCEHYAAHADEEDAHKLLSAKACIKRRAERAGSHEEYETNYAPVLLRIDSILNDIKEINPLVVSNMEQRVEQGELTSYWSAKMRVYLELERLL